MVVTGINQILCISALSIHLTTWMILSEDTYLAFRSAVGKYVTYFLTTPYLVVEFSSVLMTINRVVIIVKPMKTHLFDNSKLFLYSGILVLLTYGPMSFPLFSNCFVNFLSPKKIFVPACAPNRHIVTFMQNEYTGIPPIVCMFVNIGAILHLKFSRDGTYIKWKNFLSKNKSLNSVEPLQKNTSTNNSKREKIMLKQTISMTAYISIYEMSAVLMKSFPNQWSALPDDVRNFIFDFRCGATSLITFFVYFIQTASTRNMILTFLGLDKNTLVNRSFQSNPVQKVTNTRSISIK